MFSEVITKQEHQRDGYDKVHRKTCKLDAMASHFCGPFKQHFPLFSKTIRLEATKGSLVLFVAELIERAAGICNNVLASNTGLLGFVLGLTPIRSKTITNDKPCRADVNSTCIRSITTVYPSLLSELSAKGTGHLLERLPVESSEL